MSLAAETRHGVPYGVQLLQAAAQAGLIAALSDRDWRTLAALLLVARQPGRLQLDYAELSAVLPAEEEEWRARLAALAAARLRGEPVIYLIEDERDRARWPAVWFNHWLIGNPGEVGPGDLSPVYHYAERLMGRPLANVEILAIRRWHTEFGLERDVIVELLAECGEERGIKRWQYLEAVARGWFDDGVRTLADLQRRRNENRELLARYTRIINYLSLGRAPTEPEKQMMRRWSYEWGFSDEVILRACDEAVGARYPLRHANRVLEYWQSQGVRNLAEAEALLAQRRQTRQKGGVRDGKQRGEAAGTNAAARPTPAGLRRKQSWDDLIIR